MIAEDFAMADEQARGGHRKPEVFVAEEGGPGLASWPRRLGADAGKMRPSRRRAMVDAELVAERHDLGRQGGSRPEEYDEGAGQEAYQGEHPGRIQGEGQPADAYPRGFCRTSSTH